MRDFLTVKKDPQGGHRCGRCVRLHTKTAHRHTACAYQMFQFKALDKKHTQTIARFHPKLNFTYRTSGTKCAEEDERDQTPKCRRVHGKVTCPKPSHEQNVRTFVGTRYLWFRTIEIVPFSSALLRYDDGWTLDHLMKQR